MTQTKIFCDHSAYVWYSTRMSICTSVYSLHNL